jgi:hypothetical protein
MRLAAQAQPFDDADGGGVLRIQPRENPVKAEGTEAQIDDGPRSLGCVAFAGIGRIEDVTDLGLERGLAGGFRLT